MGIAHLIYAERYETIVDLSLYLLATIPFNFNLSKKSQFGSSNAGDLLTRPINTAPEETTAGSRIIGMRGAFESHP